MNRPSEYTLERQRKQQERKQIVLIALILATLILTGVLSGCATDPAGWEDSPSAKPLPAVVHRMSDPYDLWRACNAAPGTIVGCAIRDYTKGVCDIYLDGDWVLAHEQKHCNGYNHAAFNLPPYIQVTR